jgi:hypothetical protein
MAKGRPSKLIDIVQQQFGNKPFVIEDLDPNARQLAIKLLCFKRNIPNTTSMCFEIIEPQNQKNPNNYIRRVFRLKGLR